MIIGPASSGLRAFQSILAWEDLFHYDYGVVALGGDGSEVDSWQALVGSVTGYRPAHWGLAPLGPLVDYNGISPGRGALVWQSAGPRAMILDGLWEMFSGVLATKIFTVVFQGIFPGLTGYVFSAGGNIAAGQFCALQIVAAGTVRQRDDALLNADANLAAPTTLTEHVWVYCHNGTNVTWWEDGVPIANVTAAIGQATLNRVTLGAMYRGPASFSSFANMRLRSIGFSYQVATNQTARDAYAALINI